METLINGIVFLGGAGLLFGLGLSYVARKFATPLNPIEESLIKILPGANCGACGFPGCGAYAESLAVGQSEPGRCPVISPEVNKDISKILGKEIFETGRKTAVIFCGGGLNCKDKFSYDGIYDCAIASNYFGGEKECEWGCLAFGTCSKVCAFGAITWEKGKVPVIDIDKCTACGLCVKACPKKIIHLQKCQFNFHIMCSSRDKGARVRQICKPGCIGCGICVKICPKNDIMMENNLASMKYNVCDNCGFCEQKCPTKSIVKNKKFES